ADLIRFVDPPIPVGKLPKSVRDVASKWFRSFRLLTAHHTNELLHILNARPDATAGYLDEIDRLERFNQYRTGFRYWNEVEPFSWETAKRYLLPKKKMTVATSIPNVSPTDHWRCESCNRFIRNKALLKV